VKGNEDGNLSRETGQRRQKDLGGKGAHGSSRKWKENDKESGSTFQTKGRVSPPGERKVSVRENNSCGKRMKPGEGMNITEKTHQKMNGANNRGKGAQPPK